MNCGVQENEEDLKRGREVVGRSAGHSVTQGKLKHLEQQNEEEGQDSGRPRFLY